MDVVCEACGELNRDAGEFCNSCGAFLAWEESAAPVKEASPDRSASDPPTARTGDQEASRTGDRDRQSSKHAAQDGTANRGSDSGGSNEAPSAATAVLTPPVLGPLCPQCGLQNEPGRRFCAHCGEQLAPGRVAADRPPVDRQAIRQRDRASRRAFAATLPPRYRWGRIVLATVIAALVITLVILVGTDPIGWFRARWYDVRGTVVAAPGVQATIVGAATDDRPGRAEDPAALVDGTAAEWSTDWTPGKAAGPCGGVPGSPLIELTLAQPARIRGVDFRGGLGSGLSDRPLQFRPQVIGLVADGGACRAYPLPDAAGPQRLDFDTGRDVSVIKISIDGAYPPREDGLQRLSITEITLLTRPQ
jgi:hypothetical protein